MIRKKRSVLYIDNLIKSANVLVKQRQILNYKDNIITAVLFRVRVALSLVPVVL